MYHKDIPRDRNGRVRPDLRAQAMRDWDTLPLEAGYVWRSIGPERGLHPGGTPTSPLAGGLVCDFALGTNPDHVIIGTRGGGVWRSTDGGATWAPCGDGFPSLQTVTVARTEPASGAPIFLAGTGDLANEQIRNTGLVGLYRSVDGGKTWSVADGGADATILRSHDTNQVIAIDANRILVATRVGLYFSKDGGRNFGDDADHANGLPMLRGPVSVVVVVGTEVTAVVSGEPTMQPDPIPPDLRWQTRTGNQAEGIYIADLAGSSLGRFSLRHSTRTAADPDTVGNSAFDRRGPFWLLSAAKREIPDDTLAAVLAIRASPPHHSIQFTRDPTGQHHWHRLAFRALSPSLTDYVHVVALEPLRSGRAAPDAWFGTVTLFRQRILAVSGRFQWLGRERGTDTDDVHVDQHVMQVLEPSPGTTRALLGNDGGLYRTDDEGVTWRSFSDHGSIMFWTLAGARRDATRLRLIGGLQDNSTVVGEGPVDPPASGSPTSWTWQLLETRGDGGALAFIPRTTASVATEDPDEALITSSGRLRDAIGHSIGDWSVSPFLVFVIEPMHYPFSESVAIARDENGDWNRIFYGSSERRGGPGELRRGARVMGDHTVVQRFPHMISALAVAPADAATERSGPPGPWDHVWVGLANGQVLFSRNAGDSFVPMPVGGPPFPVTGIAVDPRDSRRVAVVYGGFTEAGRRATRGKVFLSENGTTFRDISGRPGPDGWVPDMPILSVAFADTDPIALIIGTDMGALITTGPRLGQRWARLGVGLPRIQCTGLAVVNGRPADPPPQLDTGLPPVAVGTFGRGAYLLTRPAAPEAVIEFDGGFGAVTVGAAYRRTLVIRNPGGSTLPLSADGPPAPFGYEALPSSLDVPPRGQVSWTVVCRPTAAGIVTANLRLTLDGVATLVPVSCEGISSGPPRLAIWPRIVSFGLVPAGDTAEVAIHLANTGHSPLHVSGAAVGNGPTGAAPSARMTLAPAIPPALTIAPGEERTLTLRFASAVPSSSHEASWIFTSDDPIGAPEHFRLTASGMAGPPGPAPAGDGTPTWVWFAVGGAVLVVGAIVGVIIYEETRSEPTP